MKVESNIHELGSLCDDFDRAVVQVSQVWDDRVQARIEADHINQMTDTAGLAIRELRQLGHTANRVMDYIIQLSY